MNGNYPSLIGNCVQKSVQNLPHVVIHKCWGLVEKYWIWIQRLIFHLISCTPIEMFYNIPVPHFHLLWCHSCPINSPGSKPNENTTGGKGMRDGEDLNKSNLWNNTNLGRCFQHSQMDGHFSPDPNDWLPSTSVYKMEARGRVAAIFCTQEAI